MIPRVRRPSSRTMITLEVRGSTLLTPNFARVTLGGPALKDLVLVGHDQSVRLFFPRKGQNALRMPTLSSEAWMAQMMMTPKSARPWVRNLTIRRSRPADDELDIEFALHDDSPMSTWARGVRPGDPAGVFDMGYAYLPPAETDWQLLVADESAVPAVLAILDHAPSTLTAEVFLEVPTAADIRSSEITAREGVRVHWISRDDPEVRPGALALDAVRRAELPPGRFYTWAAGEQRLPTTLRRHLAAELNADKADIGFAGYWRQGWSSPG
ncbi:iron utilization protein [Streptomyces toyocaensis]|uniref:Iron utilization protein n=2 Tax=Streptomyces toyocaensis TaxID=55952 RepID=A0A081XJ32_STRTO|nr:iron utilization protein [Streptomyces toyocaensis]